MDGVHKYKRRDAIIKKHAVNPASAGHHEKTDRYSKRGMAE